MTSLVLTSLAVYILRIGDNQHLFIANRYSSISCIKDKSVATCADVTRLLLVFENLTLTLAKKRCEWECNKTIVSENFCVFPFVKTSGYHLKVFVFKSNQIQIRQTKIIEKTLTSILRQSEQHEQIEIMANHGPFCKRIINDKEKILKLFMWKRQ